MFLQHRAAPRRANPAAELLDMLAYGVSQAVRVGWFAGHYMAAARLAPRTRWRDAPDPRTLPGGRAIFIDLGALLMRDWENIRAGRYKRPWDMRLPPGRALHQALADSARFFADLPAVHLRRRAQETQEIFRTRDPGETGYPRYYLQNFHHQTDGYLSERSAGLYDFQVETLFSGGADAMRRQVLVPLAQHFAGGERASLLDIACGTGRFLSFAKDNFPGIAMTGLDLSLPYLERARRFLAPWPGIALAAGNAEALPLADASVDATSCIYLFHELPRAVRAQVTQEMARVLKPGGMLVFLDSIQPGDHAPYDALLERFPRTLHEPYFADYCRHDLSQLFGDAGLTVTHTERAFFSKLVVARKG
jgi:ubiquinone/menaquinone biosynthesis C-methylase UbiE